MSENTTPTEGALTLDQATTALMGAPPEQENDTSSQSAGGAQDAPAEPNDEAEQTPGETSAEGNASEAAEAGPEGEETTQEEAAAPLDAPVYWSKDAKARFAELSPELQAVVLSQEGPREQAAAKAKAEAATERQAAQEQLQGVQALAEQLNNFLPEAVQTFQQRWGEPDWEATIRQYGAEQAAVLKARYDREQSQLQQLTQAQQRAQTEAHQVFVQTEWVKLAEVAPDLAPDVKDPTQGAQKRQEVTKYLLDAGIGRDAVAQISAAEMSLAHKAMLWDRAQAAAKAPRPVQQKPTARAPSSAARPSAAPAGSPQQRGAQSVQNAFNAKPSLDNAVALLMARSR